MNIDLPPFEAFMRKEFLYQGDVSKVGEYVPVLVLGLSSLENKALGFWCLDDGGALLGRFPVHSLTRIPHEAHHSHEALELWNAMSYHPDVHTWKRIEHARVRVLLPHREIVEGTYIVTIDWYGNALSESAGEHGWKCAHLIELDCGCLALQPNNRVLFSDASWVVNPHLSALRGRPDYLVQNQTWVVEGSGKWHTESSELMFYEDRELKDGNI